MSKTDPIWLPYRKISDIGMIVDAPTFCDSFGRLGSASSVENHYWLNWTFS